VALQHANLALEIFQESLPSLHKKNRWIFQNIGLVYEKQGKLQESLSYLKKAVNIYRQTLPITHYYITGVEQNIQHVSTQLLLQ
jgi:tetratricopeptide (TPR) repeat protein